MEKRTALVEVNQKSDDIFLSISFDTPVTNIPTTQFKDIAEVDCYLYSCTDLRFGFQMLSKVYGYNYYKDELRTTIRLDFAVGSERSYNLNQPTVFVNGLLTIYFGNPADEFFYQDLSQNSNLFHVLCIDVTFYLLSINPTNIFSNKQYPV